MTPPSTRYLVLGLDGGTFDLLDPLMAAGKLPFLARLVQGGLSARLTSVYPPKTIPAWYSFATGLDPGTLGIYGFTEPDGGPGRSRLVQTYRPAEAIWDALSRQGRRVGVVNFPIRNPYPVNGFFVPGMFADQPATFPAELAGSLNKLVGERYLPELPPYRANGRSAWMELANRAVRQRARMSEALIERFDPEFLFVLFRETDRIEHQHWAELARSPGEIPPDLLDFWLEVDRACAAVDASFRGRGGPAVTLVISDHGHGAAGTDFFTNRWLLDRGYLKFKTARSSRRRRLASRVLVTLDKFGPARKLLAPIADRLQGGPRREQFARFVTGDASFETMAKQIDWESTVAYSYPVPEAIYFNPYNPTLTPERQVRLGREIRTALEAYREADIEVFEPKDLYRSVAGTRAPALLLRINALETESRMDFSYPEAMLHHRPGYFYGTGVHRMDGILIASGEGVPASGRAARPYSLLDIAPTVLEGMSLPIPRGMAGSSFAPALGHGAG
ncbi:MAG TPA: alkaline phosphatase family protein [Thermoplasmata archaeon]|nr:alkaline phosphatase family protein [Thermoplasmata archaeon]